MLDFRNGHWTQVSVTLDTKDFTIRFCSSRLNIDEEELNI